MKLKTMWIVGGLASSLMGASVPALATAVWTSGNGSCNVNNGLYNSTGCATNFTGTLGTSLIVTAISDTGNSITGGAALASAYVGYYNTSHWGVTSRAGANSASYNPSGTSCDVTAGNDEKQCSPQHALDNNGNQEWLLYSFGADVALSQVTLGWSSNDSDITVLAYKQDAGAPVLTTGTTTDAGATNGLVFKGWSVIGNYADVCGSGCGSNATVNINAGNVSSSYWLIGAYNSLGGTALDNFSDYVKVLSVAGATTPRIPPSGVPEPSSLLLAAIALIGLTALRRRRTI